MFSMMFQQSSSPPPEPEPDYSDSDDESGAERRDIQQHATHQWKQQQQPTGSQQYTGSQQHTWLQQHTESQNHSQHQKNLLSQLLNFVSVKRIKP